MRVGLIQSNYIPWKGYFDIIQNVDLFLFYDSRQYTKNDWRNRNRIKTPHGTQWLTIPVGKDWNRNIDEVRLPDTDWASRHWRRLEDSYAGAPHFAALRPLLHELYLTRTWTHLSELNQAIIRTLARDALGIRTPFMNDDDFRGLTETKSARVLKMMQLVGATSYVTGPAARDYLDCDSFAEAGIELVWWNYAGYPSYPQMHGPFEHAVSVVDLLAHAGPEAPWHIWGWRAEAAVPLRAAS